jgi:hypothetical protein
MEKHLSKLADCLKDASPELFDEVINMTKDGITGPILLSEANISDGLRYHIDNNIPLTDPVFRRFSEEYFLLLKEARSLFEGGQLIVCSDSEWMLQGNIGEFAEYEGTLVPLDSPMALEEEDRIIKSAAEYKGKKVNIGKPRTLRKGEPGYGRKQYVVYVMNKGKVKRITFGDPNLKAKPEKAKNRKSFRARHKCDQKKDRTTPGYWACRHPPNW